MISYERVYSFLFSQEDSLPTGHWNTSGCYYEISDNNIVTCRCNHLTHFAILLSPGTQVCTVNYHTHCISIMLEIKININFCHMHVCI